MTVLAVGHERHLLACLDEVLDATEAERSAVVRSRFGTDPALLRALERLLAAAAQPDGIFMKERAEIMLRPVLSDLEAQSVSDAEVPDGFTRALAPRYSLLERIGSGGMASVYLAFDTALGRNVAIKSLRPELADGISRERFEREIEIAAAIDHPHIVPVYDRGEADGRLFYVMRYVEGGSLRDLLLERPQLEIRKAIDIARDIAEALDAAHAKKIVHRDIKPANILLDRHGAHLADFGVARLIDAAGRERLTKTGLALGTAAYMSPEQVGSAAAVDGRSDVYALACVLYEMLAGEAPFTGPTPRDIVAKHLAAAIPDLTVLRATVTRPMQQVIARALQKSPADRYATTGEFMDAFERAFLAPGDDPSPATREATLKPSIPSPRRRRQLAGLSFLAIATVVLAVSATNDEGAPNVVDLTLDPRNIAVLYFDDLSPDSSLGWLTRGLTTDLIHDLSALDTLNVISAAGVQPFRNAQVTFDSIARVLRVGTLVDGTVRLSDGRVEVTVQLIDATNGFQVRSERFEQPAQDLFKLQDEILFGISRFLRERVGQAALAAHRRAGTDNVGAWRLVQQGEELLEQGIALGRHGSSVRAWAALARADSHFEAASRLARRWAEPEVMRARVARAQYLSLSLHDPLPGQPPGSAGMVEIAVARLSVGMAHVVRALELEPGHPEASTLAGYFPFVRWSVSGTRGRSEDLLTAEARLRAVVKQRDDQPLAWVILSRIHRQRGDTLEADLAAQRAYAADPFLYEGRRALADLLMQHLQRGRFAEARELCATARQTYHDDRELVECRLRILAWSANQRDSVAAAWRELASIEALGFPELATSWTTRRMHVAAVAARAGLRDSALAIVARAYATRGVMRADSTSAAIAEAWIRLLTGDHSAALDVLDSLVSADGGQRERYATHPWFATLRGNARFERIVNGPSGLSPSGRRQEK